MFCLVLCVCMLLLFAIFTCLWVRVCLFTLTSVVLSFFLVIVLDVSGLYLVVCDTCCFCCGLGLLFLTCDVVVCVGLYSGLCWLVYGFVAWGLFGGYVWLWLIGGFVEDLRGLCADWFCYILWLAGLWIWVWLLCRICLLWLCWLVIVLLWTWFWDLLVIILIAFVGCL